MSTNIITAANVRMIPVAGKRHAEKKIRAACYARVSSEQDSQQLSYATQKRYFIDYIKSQEEEQESKVIFGGRLGEYKYYDMDAVIASALDLCKREL